MVNANKMYWELYDDQFGKEFSFVGYTSLTGKETIVPIENNFTEQVSRIKRENGKDTEIKVYRE